MDEKVEKEEEEEEEEDEEGRSILDIALESRTRWKRREEKDKSVGMISEERLRPMTFSPSLLLLCQKWTRQSPDTYAHTHKRYRKT